MKCKYCKKDFKDERNITLGWHICKERSKHLKEKKYNDTLIIGEGGEGSSEEQRERYKDDIAQPYHENGKVNERFIKVHGKKNHPEFNKKVFDECSDD